MCMKLWRSFLFQLLHQWVCHLAKVCHKLFLKVSESPTMIQMKELHVSDALSGLSPYQNGAAVTWLFVIPLTSSEEFFFYFFFYSQFN